MFQNRSAFCAALHELERQHGLKYVSDKLPKGSMLLEVRSSLALGLSHAIAGLRDLQSTDLAVSADDL